MRTNSILLSLAAASGLVASTFVFAQEATPQPAPQPIPVTATSTSSMPSRGSTMEDVKSKFGSPSQEVPAIGQPPITRWEYPGYVVFFENDRVLHTVVVRG